MSTNDTVQTPRSFGPPRLPDEYWAHQQVKRAREVHDRVRAAAERSRVRSKTKIAGHRVVTAVKNQARDEPWWRDLFRGWPERWKK